MHPIESVLGDDATDHVFQLLTRLAPVIELLLRLPVEAEGCLITLTHNPSHSLRQLGVMLFQVVQILR